MFYRSTMSIALASVFVAGCAGGTGTYAPTPQTGVDTEFSVNGRYIELTIDNGATSTSRAAQGTALPFFVKGMVYSPSPIGQGPFDSPVKDSNIAIWSRDLPAMRAMGVNAIHLYNVTPPPYDSATGPITKFLNAAWNNGVNPIYVIMSVYFTGDKLLNAGAVSALASQYHDLDKKYASYPAVMGVAISNEIGSANYLSNPTWWQNFNVVAKAAKQGFVDGGDGSKIVTTSEADGNIGAVQYGEQYKAAVDVWGINVYRGRTFTNLYAQIAQFTTKPVFLTEYGASAAYHPNTGSTYTFTPGPTGLGSCNMGSGSTSISDVAELPASGNPNMAGLVDLVTNNAATLYAGFKNNGIISGGFYFEWTDEWWKANAGNNLVHYGNVAPNGAYPGCNEDQGWYGLNSVAPGAGGGLDVLTPRATLSALQAEWGREP